MSAIFITATGTDIGKTFIAAGLIRHFRAAGLAIDALKPVATGFDLAASASSDPGVLLTALGRPVTQQELDRVSPWHFAAPLSPDMAAWKESKSIEFEKLVEFSRRAIARATGTLLIEGVGGVMVPLDDSHSVLDWMAALDIPALLVTGSYLGSLSHTLTALDALRRRGVAIKALIVNETPGSPVTMPDTIATLSRFAKATPVIALSRDPTGHRRSFAGIADLL
jgi:dethiobiotin synthetase